MASAKARGKNPFSDDEEDSGGENEKEPPLPSHLQPAAGVAAAHRSDTDWASGLTGTVNSSNSFSWNPSTGSPQHSGSSSAAYTTPKADSRTCPPHSPWNTSGANTGGKRATTTSPTPAAKKKRQVDQEGDSGAAGATDGTTEDKDGDLY